MLKRGEIYQNHTVKIVAECGKEKKGENSYESLKDKEKLNKDEKEKQEIIMHNKRIIRMFKVN